ncbi:YafY family protein [Nonomuraea sp. MCN248]|uniref:YafY family protein n=1 Tax=Nonomuraea corallina TaxID=2989783 RepID=A0ABT4SGJ9_9ACTN|nr:YafY family protein [Nonomuraea corallina]MDA0636120.1 YafY family protein [Nonomuraea corallina]
MGTAGGEHRGTPERDTTERDTTELGTTERVLTLLGLLQQRQVWTGPELADRLGVTTRTVRRDVERLRALGYPISAGQGIGGGYRLGPGQDLPPLLLDDEEATATVAALLTGAGSAGGARTGGAGAGGTDGGGPRAAGGDAALRALAKLDRVLPTRLRHQVRALSGSVESFAGGRAPVDPDVLMTLARACRDEVEAGFGYPSGDEVRRRRVEPYRLVASDRHWYLLAYDLDRDDWRTFRLDRMTEVSARTWRFRPRPAPDAAAYVQEGVASKVYPHRARFLVHAPADTVRARLPGAAAVVRPRGSERCELTSGAASLDFVLMHVLLLGYDFEILDPPELGARCRVLAERLLSAATTIAPQARTPT